MKKSLCLIAFLLLSQGVFGQQKQTEDFGLPVLHVIREVSLSPSYSCRSTEDLQKGYSTTALFVSAFSKNRNSPDLLFNGACNSEDYFQVSTAGDDMALIADLGENLSLETISAHKTFNLQNIAREDADTKFTRTAKVVKNHTYAVLLNKGELRGLIVFSVSDYLKNKKVDLKYSVKMYEIFANKIKSPDFDWEKGNSGN